MVMDRRMAIGLAGLGIIASRLASAQHYIHMLATRPENYKLQFFTARENALLDQLAEMIIPADDHSPGAHEAKVSFYIDLIAANSSDDARAKWKSRLKAFEDFAQAREGKPFLRLAPMQQRAVIDALAANEKKPSTAEEHFFLEMKRATIFAYYTSPVGLLKDLGYKGNQVLAVFPGCALDPLANRIPTGRVLNRRSLWLGPRPE